MGGDHLKEPIQRNLYTFESDYHTSWCGGGVNFFASDQLVYLEQPCARDLTSTSSSPSSQVTMDDDGWILNNLNNHTKLQESISMSNSTKSISNTHQQPLLFETKHTAKGCYASPNTNSYSHGRIKANDDVVSAAAPKRKYHAREESEHGNKKKRPTETKSHLQITNDNKVSKEKMGNRIVTLQRLVSPFGKADTASVLSESIEYIKFLHEQVSVLSTMCSTTNAMETEHFQDLDVFFLNQCVPDSDPETGLRKRGLCIVPVLSALRLTNDIPWTTASHDSESSNLQM